MAGFPPGGALTSLDDATCERLRFHRRSRGPVLVVNLVFFRNFSWTLFWEQVDQTTERYFIYHEGLASDQRTPSSFVWGNGGGIAGKTTSPGCRHSSR